MASVLEAIAQDELEPDGPRLITVDELRAAGALDVPAAWRKSLGVGGADALPLFAALPAGEPADAALTARVECPSSMIEPR